MTQTTPDFIILSSIAYVLCALAGYFVRSAVEAWREEPSEPEQEPREPAPRPASSLPPVRPRRYEPTVAPACRVCPTADRCGETPPEECGVLNNRSRHAEG